MRTLQVRESITLRPAGLARKSILSGETLQASLSYPETAISPRPSQVAERTGPIGGTFARAVGSSQSWSRPRSETGAASA
jgi:hypothetical protein